LQYFSSERIINLTIASSKISLVDYPIDAPLQDPWISRTEAKHLAERVTGVRENPPTEKRAAANYVSELQPIDEGNEHQVD
jgi:hypothetical protein